MLQTLTTPRGETLSGTPWQVYPRPQMRRDSYINLNGEWDFAVSSGKPETFDMRITVPFCPESRLSGIGRHFEEGAPLWYRRRFLLPEGFRRERVLLHIGAADQIAEVFVNGQHLCRHEGGYASFCVDITEALAEENELVIRCTDDLHDQAFPYGKQVMNRGGMWYTPVSGIWQTVWLESVPGTYIENLNIENHGASVTISTVPPLEGTVSVEPLGQFPLENGQVTIAPENPHFWCPDDPYLYRFTVETAQDKVESYFAIRSLGIKKVGEYPRLCLNGKPYFFHGLLDQGYWPEGLLGEAVTFHHGTLNARRCYLRVAWDDAFDSELYGPIEIVDWQVGVFQNHRLITWADTGADIPADVVKEFDDRNGGRKDYLGYRVLRIPDFRIAWREGDVLSIAIRARDQHGREFFFTENPDTSLGYYGNDPIWNYDLKDYGTSFQVLYQEDEAVTALPENWDFTPVPRLPET